MDPFRCRIDIGFRVEVHDTYHWLRNCTFRDQGGNMSPRDATRHPDAAVCRDHLDIDSRRPGPFISMFKTWHAALRKREYFLSKGATKVVIIAVWLKGLARVYDVYNIAEALGIRKCDPYLHEVLLWGGITADDYRILAVLSGMGDLLPAVLSLPGLNMEVRLPPAFIHGVQEKTQIATNHYPNATSRLQDEIHSLTGTQDNRKFFRLALFIGGCRYTSHSLNEETIWYI